jgi:3-oxoacyl-[acyl-carrier protein] reductase
MSLSPPHFGSDSPWSSGATDTSEIVLEEPQPVPPSPGFRDKNVVVTGGATGLGLGICLEFARRGCGVAFCFLDLPDRDVAEQALLAETALAGMGVPVYAVRCDVRDSAQVDGFISRATDRLGGLHYLVNNAGIAMDGALWRMTDDSWRRVLDTNITGAFNCIRAVTPEFRSQRYGKIVNVSAHQAERPGFGVANYAASKAALIGLTRAAAVELGPTNINVNAVAPGFVRTERLSLLPPEVVDRAEKSSVLGRVAEPDDIARVIAFLCSDEARHITGQTITVDGGMSLE